MKYQFIFNESKQSINLKQKSKTVSTVWVPLWLNYAVTKGIARYGNMEKYLGVLLRKYRFLFYGNLIPPSENVKTEYQKRGENYVIKKFRPELRDWLELGFWADSLGYSKAYMFVKLVEIDEANEHIVNERLFLYFSYVVTTPFYARVPQLRKVLRKGRSIFEREITFYDPPE